LFVFKLAFIYIVDLVDSPLSTVFICSPFKNIKPKSFTCKVILCFPYAI